MYDTARRVALVKQRVRENTRRRQRREVGGLPAVCLLLLAALMQTAGTVVAPGQTAAWGVFGAMLLREDAGGYVLVGVVSFTAAAVITTLCFRLPRPDDRARRLHQCREQQHTHSAQSIDAAPLPPAGGFPHPLLDECDPSCGIVHFV